MVRKPSPAVYRRRRLFLGAAVLLVIALVVRGFALAGAFSGSSEQASSTDPAASRHDGDRWPVQPASAVVLGIRRSHTDAITPPPPATRTW
jgi:hypothetical protein